MKSNHKKILLLPLLITQLQFCGSSKKDEQSNVTNVESIAPLASVAQVASVEKKPIQKTSFIQGTQPKPPAAKPQQPSLVRSLTSAQRKKITLEALNDSLQMIQKPKALPVVVSDDKKDAPALLTAAPATKPVPKTANAAPTFANPYFENEVLTTMFFRREDILTIVHKEKITKEEELFIAKACSKAAVDTGNKFITIQVRLQGIFKLAKVKPIFEEMKNNLGNFKTSYEKLNDQQKEILLPLMAAFHFYNQVERTNFNESQGPGFYISKNAITNALSETMILGRIDLSADTAANGTTPLSKENISLIIAITEIWSAYKDYYLDTQKVPVDPILVGYTSRSANRATAQKIAAAEINKVKLKVGELSSPKLDIPPEDFAYLLDNNDPKSAKNNRVEVVLYRKVRSAE